MITKAKLEELRKLHNWDMVESGIELLDTISTLYQQNEELKSSRPNYCVECGTGVGMMCASCCAKHLHKLERVAKAAEEVYKYSWPSSHDSPNALQAARDLDSALAALREGE